MSGFEYTPMGIMPLGAYRPVVADEHAIEAASADVFGPSIHPASVHAPVEPRTVPQRVHAEAKPLRPVDVVKMARARLRDVEREIKRLKKLEAERAELKRLLDAAAGKSLAVVRSMPTRSA